MGKIFLLLIMVTATLFGADTFSNGESKLAVRTKVNQMAVEVTTNTDKLQNVSANGDSLIVSGFTILGESAPAVKMAVMSIRCPSSLTGGMSTNIGISADKIISLTGMILSDTRYYPPSQDTFYLTAFGSSVSITISSEAFISQWASIYILYTE